MSNELTPLGPWERVAFELRACKESQEKAWGDIDNTTLGRYLAGEVSADELQRVEIALEERPELRKLTDLVRDVLAGIDTDLPLPEPASAPPTPAPVVLRFTPRPLPRRRVALFLRRHAPVAAAACLLLALGLLMPRPGFLSAPRPDVPLPTSGLASARPFLAMSDAAPPAPPLARNDRNTGMAGGFSPETPFPVSPPRPVVALNNQLARGRSDIAPHHAAARSRRGLYYRAQGDLTRAAPELAQAHNFCQAKLGPDHPATQRTAVQLAGVYQVALNTEDKDRHSFFATTERALPTPAVARVASPPPPAPASVPPPAPLSLSAHLLRERITSLPAQDVQTSVVPVLTQALRVARTAEERCALINALARLGPAARDAVPVLNERLQRGTPLEVRCAREALCAMGPAAGLEGRDGRVGVCDSTGRFSVRVLRDATLALRQLACRTEIEVLIETCSGIRKTESRLGHMGERAIHIRIDTSRPAVEVHVSPMLQRDGFAADPLRQHVLRHLKHRHYDSALAAGVRQVLQLDHKKDE